MNDAKTSRRTLLKNFINFEPNKFTEESKEKRSFSVFDCLINTNLSFLKISKPLIDAQKALKDFKINELKNDVTQTSKIKELENDVKIAENNLIQAKEEIGFQLYELNDKFVEWTNAELIQRNDAKGDYRGARLLENPDSLPEFQPKNKSYNPHISVNLKFDRKTELNYAKIYELVRQFLGIPGAFINFKRTNNYALAKKLYDTKTQRMQPINFNDINAIANANDNINTNINDADSIKTVDDTLNNTNINTNNINNDAGDDGFIFAPLKNNILKSK